QTPAHQIRRNPPQPTRQRRRPAEKQQQENVWSLSTVTLYFAMRLDPMLQSAPSPAVIAVPAPPVTGCGFPGKTAIANPQAGRVPPDAAVMQGGSAPAGQVF